MPRLVLILAAALCLAFGFAACGDDDDGDTTVTETETVQSSTEATDTEDTTSTEEASTDPLPPESAGKEGPKYFTSPSENIGCYVSPEAARCDIRKRSWKPTPPPRPCELDYGQGIAVGETGAEFICAGDTALGGPNVLDYGERAQRGNYFCDSSEAGITCSNLETGAGFFISRESYRIF